MPKYTMQTYWQEEGAVSPFLPALTLKYDTIEGMRSIVKTLADHAEIPVHSVTITAEDGKVERWFKLDGQWRRKDGA